MSLLELLVIAVGLSMDAFAVAVGAGLTMRRVTLIKSLTIGLYFGIFQAVMPTVGYLLASWFAGGIIAFDHWIAFALLTFIGGRMLAGGLKKENRTDGSCPEGGTRELQEASLKPARMLPLAFATSVDALAAGVSFAFLKVNIIPAVLSIGAITLTLSMAGVKVGGVFGERFKSKAEVAGGVILILIGLKTLLGHLL